MALSPDLVDDPFFTAVARLADCLCEELAAAHGPDLCYCGLALGDAPPPLGLSNCKDGDCGVAWVRIVTAFPSATFPLPDDGVGATGCSAPLAYEVEIGVARCAPRAKERQMFPDKQDVFETQRLVMSDMRAAKRAILCCLPLAVAKAGEPKVVTAVGSWRPLENAAQKTGGIWQGFIGLA